MIQRWDDSFVNFTPDELKCKKSGGYAFHTGFAKSMQMLRTTYDRPMYITSCCRSKEYNDSLNNSSNRSLHIYDSPSRGANGTCAFDCSITDSQDRHEFIKIALLLGFSCYFIGGNPEYIHCDLRTALGEPARFW